MMDCRKSQHEGKVCLKKCGTQEKCRREDPVKIAEAARLRAMKPGAPLLIFMSLGPTFF